MRCILAVILSLTVSVAALEAVEVGITGVEPPKEVLGAPLYPNAQFIRTLSSLDPYYESVFYVCPDPVGDVKNYFARELTEAREVRYIDEDQWVWTFLLRAWIPFPDKPTRDDLPLLDVTPNVMVKKFQRDLFEPLIELFESKKDNEKQIEALNTAKTIIRYTYRKIEEDIAFQKIMGTWKNSDRDLPDYYGCVLRFDPDSSYTCTYTDENLDAMARKLSSSQQFKGKASDEIMTYLRERNPEKGKYAIMRNIIDMIAETPPIGDKVKSGLAEVSASSVTIQLINTPRLTFIRQD